MRRPVAHGYMLFLVVLAVAGCSTVTIRDQGERKLSSSPNYKESKHFFLWGLVKDYDINVSDVCNGGEAEQMQTQFTFVDGLFAFLTLGIYSPRTAKVWCK